MRKTGRHDDGRLPLVQWGARVLYIWATCVVSIGIFRGDTSVGRYFALKESERILTQAVGSIENENAKLSDEIGKLRASKDYARKVLRDKYHVTEEGEKIIYYAD